MLEGFEDAFTDAQANVVSLCLELLENSDKSADKVYIYLFQNDVQDFINAFFEKDGQIYSLNDWFTDEQVDEFFDCGVEDIENIIEICDTYDGKCPNVFKLIYNVNTKAFDTDYVYEDIISDSDIGLVEDFQNWREECKSKLS
jgi:hypothetical protein